MLLKDTNIGSRKLNGKTLTGRKSRDLLPAENFTVKTPAKTITVSGSSSGTLTIKDVNFNTFTGATTRSLTDVLAAVPLGGYATGPATFSSASPGVATVDGNGIVSAVAAGTTVITVTVPGLTARKVPVVVAQLGGQISMSFSALAAGSLAASLASTIASATSGKTPGSTTYNLFGTFSPPGSFARNSNQFLAGIDWTCIPAYCSNGDSRFLGALVSPRHLIGCNHATLANGTTLYFVDGSNNVTTRTIAGSQQIGGTDLRVYLLSADVAAGVGFAAVLPTNFRSYLPQPSYGYACVFSNQDRTLRLGDCIILPAAGTGELTITTPTDSNRAAWYLAVRSGDSGSPAFMVIGGAAVLVCTWHYAGASGPILSDNISAINAAMSSLGGGYALTTVDLSAFNSY